MSSINLFHASGFFVFCLKIVCSIFTIKILAKAIAIFVPTAVPCIKRYIFFPIELERILFKNEAEHFLKKVCSYRRVFVMEFFVRLAYYK